MLYNIYMLLLLHIIIATTSIIYTAYVYFFPTRSKLNIAYSLVAGTLISGTFLLLSTPSHMVSTCITGLTYLGEVSIGIISARHKLARRSQ